MSFQTVFHGKPGFFPSKRLGNPAGVAMGCSRVGSRRGPGGHWDGEGFCPGMEMFLRVECPSVKLCAHIEGILVVVVGTMMVMQPPTEPGLPHPWPTVLCWSLTSRQLDSSWAWLCPKGPSPLLCPPHWSCLPAPTGAVPGCWVLWVPGHSACLGWSYANAAPHPSAQPVSLSIFSWPRATLALPWPPALSCSLG